MLKRGFQVFGALLLTAYAWAGFAGWELPSNTKKGVVGGGVAERDRFPGLQLLDGRKVMNWWQLHGHQVISALVFSAIGMVAFAVFFFTLPKVLPFSLKKEILEDENTALGIVIARDRPRDGVHHRAGHRLVPR